MIDFIKRFPGFLSIPIVVFLWAVIAHFGWVGKSLLAGPNEVFAVLLHALHPDTPGAAIYRHAAETVMRATAGWAITLVVGGALGLLFGLNTVLYRAAESLFEFARAIPPIMAFPLLLVMFNFESPAYVWTIAVGCIPIMVLTVARGIHSLDHTRLELLSVHGVSTRLRVLASIVEILPAVFLGARLTFSISLIVAVVTEMVFSPRSGYGLGSLAKDSQISFDTATFYACIFILGFYGYVVNTAMRYAEHWLSGGEGQTA